MPVAIGSRVMEWINENREWLIKGYSGKWIALGSRPTKKKVFSGDTLEEACEAAVRAGVKRPYYQFKV